MKYLERLGLNAPNYDRHPHVEVKGHDNSCWAGWQSITNELKSSALQKGENKCVIAIECYPGVFDDEILSAISSGIPDAQIFRTTEALKSPAEINKLVEPDLGGDDPVFGKLTRLELDHFLDTDKKATLEKAILESSAATVIVYGTAALLCTEADIVVYADMARWEAQLRQRANRVSNLGVNNSEQAANLKYKRSFYIDWRVCDRLKQKTFERWDYLLDTCKENSPKMITGDAFRDGINQTLERPFRVVPFFDPGVWGGQWMKEVCKLPEDKSNYAWCFDCVPEENSLLLKFGETTIEVPSINAVLYCPEKLLGEPVYGLTGAYFPIRFDLLDTMQGQNLSFQVHPMLDYARQEFGLNLTQDESYYILDAEPEAEVYLGLVEDVDAQGMLRDLKVASEDPSRPFPDEKYVQRFPVKRHDHFLIPAGTCHCSGTDTLVLEISHTPYVFTFKLWDWDRVDLNGLPRPINLERGEKNIQWERTRSWVEPRLVNQFEKLSSGEGWQEEKTGLYKSQLIETRRHWFEKPVAHDTKGESVHVLNLVAGQEATVESPTGRFEPFVVHFAETFIVPASVGPYIIRPSGPSEGQQCATIKAFIRVNA
ncbi:MAG: class I mannose-6-phosphate isomerase [Opitutales bacterium]|nr:class I mannose-6-phosphate isomerase [Opitutales bacterium]